MTEGAAIQKARGGGNALGKMVYGSKDIHLRLMYLESIEITFRLHYKKPFLKSLFSKEMMPDLSQKIVIIVEGTRCQPSYNDKPLDLIQMDIPEGDIQQTEYSERKITEKASRLAKRIVRRQSGRIVTQCDMERYRSFYRPYYVAFYGEPKMGEKIRYIAIEADGFKVETAL